MLKNIELKGNLNKFIHYKNVFFNFFLIEKKKTNEQDPEMQDTPAELSHSIELAHEPLNFLFT